MSLDVFDDIPVNSDRDRQYSTSIISPAET
jgi:hypothetical protein